jgi:hypothetical protein
MTSQFSEEEKNHALGARIDPSFPYLPFRHEPVEGPINYKPSPTEDRDPSLLDRQYKTR